MILFCEDCGTKNHLEQTQLLTNTAVFRCTSCNYKNKIKIEHDKINDYFKAIQSSSEIVGSFLFHVQKGVVKNQMPDVLKQEDLIFLGKTLVKNYKICAFVYPDITRMTLVIDKRNLVLQMVNTDLALILSCKHFPVSNFIESLMTRGKLDKLNIEV